MKNIEDNKLIAEFMGVKPQYFGASAEYEMYGVIESIEDGWDEQHFFTVEDMLFDSDWNWMMGAIKYLRSTEEFNSIDFIPQGLGDEEMIKGLLTQDIDLTFKGLVKGIKWYNTKK